jgi:hypothetical protein
MPFDPLTWLIGYALKKSADKVESAFGTMALDRRLNAVVTRWVDSLPSDAELDASALFSIPTSPLPLAEGNVAREHIAKDLQNGYSVTSDNWFNALKERWLEVRAPFRPGERQLFFELSTESADKYLHTLAQELQRVCDTEPDLFRRTVMELLREIHAGETKARSEL